MEGLAHVSEIQRDPKVKLDKTFKVGDPIRARIIKIDTGDKKIGLSTRDVAPLTPEESAQVSGTPKEEGQEQEQPAETPQD